MSKLSRITSLAVLLALPFLGSACETMQPPSGDATRTTSGDGTNTATNINTRQPPFSRGPGENTSVNDPGLGTNEPIPANIDVDNPPAESIVVTIYFGFDQYNIQASERAKLIEAAKKISADPSLKTIAVGHTDWFGSDQYNLGLSDRRASSVRNFLGSNGANADQTQILARGKIGAAPDVKKDSSEAKHDRRVDLIKVPANFVPPAAGVAGAAGGPAAAVAP